MTTTISKKDAHLAACAKAKIEGDQRRAEKAATKAAAHAALIQTQKDEGAARRQARIDGHVARNAKARADAVEAKAVKAAANDEAPATDVAA